MDGEIKMKTTMEGQVYDREEMYWRTETALLLTGIKNRFSTFRDTPYIKSCKGVWFVRDHDTYRIDDEQGKQLCHICLKCGKVWYDLSIHQQYIEAGYIDPNGEKLKLTEMF